MNKGRVVFVYYTPVVCGVGVHLMFLLVVFEVVVVYWWWWWCSGVGGIDVVVTDVVRIATLIVVGLLYSSVIGVGLVLVIVLLREL